MQLGNRSLNIILLKCFFSIFLLYILFTPIMFIYNINTNISGWYFMIASILKLGLIATIGIVIRKKNKGMLINNRKQAKMYMVIISMGLAIVGTLHFLDIPLKIYDIVSRAIGIYNMPTTNLFLVILYEQLFSNYLVTSMLICSAIVFCYRPNPKNLKENLDCTI